jgi:4-hydroxy-4-methyl-2-oxoglutarate aldolase
MADQAIHQPRFTHQSGWSSLDPAVIAALLEVSGLASAVSDELDARGLRGAVPVSVAPLVPGSKVIGPALTLRYLPERSTAAQLTVGGSAGHLGNAALAAAARRGQVAVIDGGGVTEVSLLGGLAAADAQAAGIVAALVDGAVRDIDEIVATGLPVWASARTPASGRRRMEAVELNGWIGFGGVQVRPGDVAVADDSGICFVPPERFAEVAAAILGNLPG